MKNVTITFKAELDGDTFSKIALCLKKHEPDIFAKMVEEFKPEFTKILKAE